MPWTLNPRRFNSSSRSLLSPLTGLGTSSVSESMVARAFVGSGKLLWRYGDFTSGGDIRISLLVELSMMEGCLFQTPSSRNLPAAGKVCNGGGRKNRRFKATCSREAIQLDLPGPRPFHQRGRASERGWLLRQAAWAVSRGLLSAQCPRQTWMNPNAGRDPG